MSHSLTVAYFRATILQSHIVPFHQPRSHFEEKFIMTVYEHASNAFAVIGLLATSGIIGLIGWHAVVAFRRFRANRPARLRERAMAAVRKAPIPSPLRDETFGDC